MSIYNIKSPGLGSVGSYQVSGKPYPFSIPALELKVSEIYLSGSATNVDVIAGLTGIGNSEIPNNWSGSSGVG